MKKALLLFLVFLGNSLVNADIIDGNTDTAGKPRSLLANPIFVGYESGHLLTTSIKNHTLTNLSSTDRLLTFTTVSHLVLEDTTLQLDGDFTFSHGSIKINGNVKINGSGNKFSLQSHSLIIGPSATLTIGPGVIFEFSPTMSKNNALLFYDSTSKLALDSSTLKINNGFGMLLTHGELNVSGACTIDNDSTDTTKGLFFGVGPSSFGDCKLRISDGASLDLKNAGIVYRNRGSNSFINNGKISGNFLVQETFNLGGQSLGLDLNNFRGQFQPGRLNGFDLGGQIGAGLNLTGDPTSAGLSISPDGKHLITITDGTEEIRFVTIDRTSGTPLVQVSAIPVMASGVGQYCVFSSDNIHALAGGSSSSNPDFVLLAMDPINSGMADNGGLNVGGIRSAWFSHDGRLVCANTGDTDVRLYHVDPNDGLYNEKDAHAINTRISDIKFTENISHVIGERTRAADSGNSADIILFEVNQTTMELTQIVMGQSLLNTNTLNIGGGISISPDRRYVVTGYPVGADSVLRMFKFDPTSTNTFERVGSGGPRSAVGSCLYNRFSPCGRYVVAGFGKDSGGESETRIFEVNVDVDSNTSPFTEIGVGIDNNVDGDDSTINVEWIPHSIDVIVRTSGGITIDELRAFRPTKNADEFTLASATAKLNDASIDLDKNTTLRNVKLELK